jgi:hypothetical protein
MATPRKGTPEYDIWITLPKVINCHRKLSERMSGKNNINYGGKSGAGNIGNLVRTPRKGTPEYEAWILTPEYKEFCNKRTEATKGEKNPFFGKCHTEATKEKISVANSGKHREHPELCERNKSEKMRRINSERQRGEKSHFWKGGISFEPYCPKFNRKFKIRVRVRYNRICVKCGKTTEENGSELCVHHVNFDKQTCCKEGEKITDQKFVALCAECHGFATRYPEWAIEYYTKLVDDCYNGKSYLTEEEMKEYIVPATSKTRGCKSLARIPVMGTIAQLLPIPG